MILRNVMIVLKEDNVTVDQIFQYYKDIGEKEMIHLY